MTSRGTRGPSVLAGGRITLWIGFVVVTGEDLVCELGGEGNAVRALLRFLERGSVRGVAGKADRSRGVSLIASCGCSRVSWSGGVGRQFDRSEDWWSAQAGQCQRLQARKKRADGGFCVSHLESCRASSTKGCEGLRWCKRRNHGGSTPMSRRVNPSFWWCFHA